MLLDLVLWSLMIVLAPLALSLGWQSIAAIAPGLASSFRVIRRK